MDLKRITEILKSKQGQDTTKPYPSTEQAVLDMNKKRVGTQYMIGTGPLGAKVLIYDNQPDVHNVHYRGKVQPMSKDQAREFLTAQGSADEVPMKELMLKSYLSKMQEEDVKKIKNGKGK
jgi:saccharopine dehydrogenase-like NADP-dependent oxidoreductase